jgi:hypothetical protein
MTDPPAWAWDPRADQGGWGGQGSQGGWGGQGGWVSRSGTTAPASGGIPLRPLGAGDILSGSFTLIRQNPAATLGLTASVITGLAVAMVVIFAIAANSSGAVVLLALPTVLAAYALQVGGLAAVMGRGLLGRQLGIAEAVRQARTGWVLLTILVLALGAALMWLPLIAMLKGWGIIPALLLTAWLAVMSSLVVPVVVLERRGPFAAIGRSWRLILSSYWRVFWIYFLTYLMTSTIGFVINFPLGFASGVIAGVGLGSDAAVSVAMVIYAIAEIVIVSLTATIQIGVLVLVYADMRMRREGMDLVLQQAALSQRLTGQEFAASGFTSAYTGAAAPGGMFSGAAYPGDAYAAHAKPGDAYTARAYHGPAYQAGFANGYDGWIPNATASDVPTGPTTPAPDLLM